MEPSSRRVLPLMGVGILSAVVGTGCATSSDLQKLNQGISQSLQAQGRTMRSEIALLRDELKALRAETEGLRAQVGTFQQDTNAVFERMSQEEAMRNRTLSNLSTMTMTVKKDVDKRLTHMEEVAGETTKDIREVQKQVSGFNDRLDQLPPVVSALSAEVRSLTDTLWGSYEVEEAGLRDRLRTLEAIKKRLRPLEARQQTAPDVEK